MGVRLCVLEEKKEEEEEEGRKEGRKWSKYVIGERDKAGGV